MFEGFEEFLKDCKWLNCQLKENNLVKLTWGNASMIKNGIIAIKPSGIPFEYLKESDISVLDLKSGNQIQGKKQSVDTAIHLEVYKNFSDVKSIIHTHSTYATSWSQAGLSIPCLGTTHADHFMGDIPITRHLTEEELKSSYETSLGKAVVECYVSNNITPREMPAILLRNHGSLVFGKTKEDTINNAIVLEEVSFMALNTRILNNQLTNDMKADILYHIHYERKHGNKKYYGQ